MTNIKLATDNRKAAAQRLAEIIGGTSRYTKVPRCAYEVGPYFIEKDGTVTVPEDADLQPLMALSEEGMLEPFEVPAQEADTAASKPQEAAVEEEAGDDAACLTVSLPLDGFNQDSLERLQKLVDSKARLLKKATGAACLTIRRTEDWVEFPWWDRMPEPEETQAYMSLIAALCKKAKESKRITATEKDVESEKYAFRGFLLRLGFIGADSKVIRKTLLKNLSGSASFSSKEKADAFSAAQKAKRDAAKAAASGEPSLDTESTEDDGEVTA